MTTTPDLIESLVESAEPVRRLRPPTIRTAIWVALAGAMLTVLAAAHGVRPDLWERLQQPVFAISLASALATGVLAAMAAFRISLPDGPRRWLFLPAPALALWISTIGYGCLTDWVAISPEGIRAGEAVRCFATLLLTSVPLSIAMLVMVRYAALLRPTAVSMMGGLAIAAVTSVALSLLHDLDATMMILIWNLGSAVIIAGLAGMFGRDLLTWTSSRLISTAPN